MDIPSIVFALLSDNAERISVVSLENDNKSLNIIIQCFDVGGELRQMLVTTDGTEDEYNDILGKVFVYLRRSYAKVQITSNYRLVQFYFNS